MKNDVWIKIRDKFNCHFIENYHTATILKNTHKHMKCNTKKNLADEKTLYLQ